MYKRRKRYEAKTTAKEHEPSVSPVPNPGKETGKKPDEVGKRPGRRHSSTRTKIAGKPNEVSPRPERR